MAELFVFTLIATVIAIYSVLPRHRQLRVGYGLGATGPVALLGFAALVIVCGFLYAAVLSTLPDKLAVEFVPHGYTVSEARLFAELVQALSGLALFGVFVTTFFKRSVRIRNEGTLLSMLRDLYNKRDFGTLADVIQDKYVPLVRHPSPPEPLRQRRFQDALQQSLSEGLPRDEGNSANQDTTPGSMRRLAAWIRTALQRAHEQLDYHIADLRYKLGETTVEASSNVERLLLGSEFTNQHPQLAPELGIRIIADDALDAYLRGELVARYLHELISTPGSLLYQEIRNNQNLRALNRYRIEPDNHLLQALLSDCRRVEQLAAYKPIGDFAIEAIREQALRGPPGYSMRELARLHLSDDRLFADPVFAAIRFFDIMVIESFYQGIIWHQWLYYYDAITEEICQHYEVGPEGDASAEWPNDYSLFIYEMVSNMTGWLRSVEDVAKTNHVKHGDQAAVNESPETGFIHLDSMNTHGGGNIPKSAAICLMSCHRRILTTEAIPAGFKRSISEHIFIRCLDLWKQGEKTLAHQYARFMLHCLQENLDDRFHGPDYRAALATAYRNGIQWEISVKAMGASDFKQTLDKIILGGQ